jgi:uroporphyrinogen decarboxylase
VVASPTVCPASFVPAIDSLDDVYQLVMPDPYTTEPLVENLKATRIVVDEIGKDAFIIGRADQGPFSMIVGIEEFLIATALPGNEEKLAQLLAFSEEVVYRYALPPETPPENLHAFVEAAHLHGRYRSDGRLSLSASD